MLPTLSLCSIIWLNRGIKLRKVHQSTNTGQVWSSCHRRHYSSRTWPYRLLKMLLSFGWLPSSPCPPDPLSHHTNIRHKWLNSLFGFWGGFLNSRILLLQWDSGCNIWSSVRWPFWFLPHLQNGDGRFSVPRPLRIYQGPGRGLRPAAWRPSDSQQGLSAVHGELPGGLCRASRAPRLAPRLQRAHQTERRLPRDIRRVRGRCQDGTPVKSTKVPATPSCCSSTGVVSR